MTTAPPDPPAPSPHDAHLRRLELIISVLLRVGVTLSLILLLVGSAVSLIRHPEYLTRASTRFSQPRESFQTPAQILQGLREFPGEALMAAGLVVLILTPIFRVLISAVVFLRQRDWIFAGLTTAVLLILLVSFLAGRAG